MTRSKTWAFPKLTVISLCAREGNLQECYYSLVYQQNVIFCIYMKTNEELKNQINDTLSTIIPMMLLYLLIVISLCVRECNLQQCHYNVLRDQTVTVCTDITTNEELRNQLNETLSLYGNITWIIERLELKDCDMLNLTINELRFLSQLQEITILNSNISTLSSGNPEATIYDNGTYIC
ncbi:hypothetical protein ILUMI_19509 [Ignelater luminosus]|uniref:Uncharacterized protein n=1 Tax=Ignelater luminosus TaxID=2038154 RepID=A0A8K0G5E9_IGNLU|nr:hypothetical protein ILUMI_19509 [Ignelater luminosus]